MLVKHSLLIFYLFMCKNNTILNPRASPSKIKPLFMQCSIYFFILHILFNSDVFISVAESNSDLSN